VNPRGLEEVSLANANPTTADGMGQKPEVRGRSATKGFERRSFRQRHFELDLRELLGGLPILRRKGSQRGSEWMLSKRDSPSISDRPGLLAGGAFSNRNP
jgi:hypothetical protein